MHLCHYSIINFINYVNIISQRANKKNVVYTSNGGGCVRYWAQLFLIFRNNVCNIKRIILIISSFFWNPGVNEIISLGNKIGICYIVNRILWNYGKMCSIPTNNYRNVSEFTILLQIQSCLSLSHTVKVACIFMPKKIKQLGITFEISLRKTIRLFSWRLRHCFKLSNKSTILLKRVIHNTFASWRLRLLAKPKRNGLWNRFLLSC